MLNSPIIDGASIDAPMAHARTARRHQARTLAHPEAVKAPAGPAPHSALKDAGLKAPSDARFVASTACPPAGCTFNSPLVGGAAITVDE